MNKKVNLFLIGAGKAGTSSLVKMLAKHRDIFVPEVKEPNHFSQYTEKEYAEIDLGAGNHQGTKNITNLEDYKSLYEDVKNKEYLCDASTAYLHSEKAAKNIYDYNPDAKIIMILREPASRAYSHYLMHKRSGLTYREFSYLLKNKDYYRNHKLDISNYVYISLYYEQVKRYLDLFDHSNIKIFFYDDFINGHQNVLDELFDFLQIDNIELDNIQENKAMVPKNKYLSVMLHIIYNIKKYIPSNLRTSLKSLLFTADKPKLNSGDKRYMYDHYFSEDVEKLERLLSVDLSHWKKY